MTIRTTRNEVVCTDTLSTVPGGMEKSKAARSIESNEVAHTNTSTGPMEIERQACVKCIICGLSLQSYTRLNYHMKHSHGMTKMTIRTTRNEVVCTDTLSTIPGGIEKVKATKVIESNETFSQYAKENQSNDINVDRDPNISHTGNFASIKLEEGAGCSQTGPQSGDIKVEQQDSMISQTGSSTDSMNASDQLKPLFVLPGVKSSSLMKVHKDSSVNGIIKIEPSLMEVTEPPQKEDMRLNGVMSCEDNYKDVDSHVLTLVQAESLLMLGRASNPPQ